MEQKSLDGAAPLAPPASDVAQAYLAEATAVREPRELRIDRRGAARLALVEAAVLAGYLTAVMLSLGTSPGSLAVLILVGLFSVWSQLVSERRESYGFTSRGVGSSPTSAAVFGALILVGVGGGVVAQATGTALPLWLRLLPGALVLVVLGGMAVRDLRSAGPAPLAEDPPSFTPAARWATFGLGVLVGFGVWAATQTDPLIPAAAGLILLLAVIAWWTATQVNARLPSLGAVWGAAPWAAFGVASTLLVAALIWMLMAGTVPAGLGAAAGAVCVIAFAIAAVPDGRRAR